MQTECLVMISGKKAQLYVKARVLDCKIGFESVARHEPDTPYRGRPVLGNQGIIAGKDSKESVAYSLQYVCDRPWTLL